MLRADGYFFERLIKKNLLAQTYLFLGDDTKTKLELIKKINLLLNCQSVLETACGDCLNCRWILDDKHPATPIIISPDIDSKKQIIKISSVKALQEKISKSSDYFRVLVFSDVSNKCLEKESANALLKTLEEKQDRVLFILLAESKDTVLDTISSRAQKFYFNLIEDESSETLEFEDLLTRSINIFFNNERSVLERIKLIDEILNLDDQNLKSFFDSFISRVSKLENFDFKLLNKIDAARNLLRAFVRPRAILEDLFLLDLIPD